jgi:putative phosphoesterase
MKLAIISDIHDNLVNLKKCLNWCEQEKIGQLICLGDVTNGETLRLISEKFKNKIYLVRGNLEIYDEQETRLYANVEYCGRIGRAEIGNKKIGLCHEPYLIEEVIKSGKCDLIFYGHTHKPWEMKKRGIKCFNPGTLGGVFTKATFAVWNAENNDLELKILEIM